MVRVHPMESEYHMDDLWFKQPVVFDKELLASQAATIYNLAMQEMSSGNNDGYRVLMGVANMLYMIENETYEVIEIKHYGNTGIY